MLTYTHRDTYLCEPCGVALLRAAPKDRRQPRGPVVLPAMDCPMHCERCGLFLENALTDVGREFVASWVEVPPESIEQDSVRLAVAAWKRFYFLD